MVIVIFQEIDQDLVVGHNQLKEHVIFYEIMEHFENQVFLQYGLYHFLPYFFYLGKTKKIWYFLSLIPILSIALSRSLTGVIVFVLHFLIFLLIILIHKKIEFNLIDYACLFLIVIFFSSSFSYQFPPDNNYCPKI